MTDKERTPRPEEIGGTGSVSAGSPAPKLDRGPWGEKDGAQPPGQAPSPEEGYGESEVGGPHAGSGM
jgi:hypothetical protein